MAVFIDGCFWHGCPEHGNAPAANSDWWQRKLDANQARDRDTDRLLYELGWVSIRFWEHENPEEVARLIQEALGAAQSQT